ncbi:hypothetical protein [Metalysinibacillus jejuensis]|uniref:hypothetical protein n=1 Tax=Metalysinibacillus jejuensis TaxID=914327 RepID=UPI000D35DE0F|nr:hypothetical protein [Metalysinibacillus jejuensis]
MKVNVNGATIANKFKTAQMNTGLLNKNNPVSEKNSPAVIFSQSGFKPNMPNDVLKDFSNDLARLKIDLKNSTDSESASKLVDEFLATHEQHKEKGVFDGKFDEFDTNQILQNSVLDLVDEVRAKLVDEHAQNNFKEMKARGNMVRFLTQALGISGEINYGEESVSRMVKLYEEKLKDGTLTSDNVKILDLEAFNKFREKNSKDIEEAIKERDAYGSLVQKLVGFKHSLVQYFKDNKTL